MRDCRPRYIKLIEPTLFIVIFRFPISLTTCGMEAILLLYILPPLRITLVKTENSGFELAAHGNVRTCNARIPIESTTPDIHSKLRLQDYGRLYESKITNGNNESWITFEPVSRGLQLRLTDPPRICYTG